MLSVLLLLTACGGSNKESTPVQSDADEPISTATIIGTWAYTVEGTQCAERVIFNADRTFSATSLDEILTGNYSLESQDSTKPLYKITTRVLTDNLLADCNGDNNDNAGQGDFASFFGFSDANTLIRYTNASADVPQRVFTREN